MHRVEQNKDHVNNLLNALHVRSQLYASVLTFLDNLEGLHENLACYRDEETCISL